MANNYSMPELRSAKEKSSGFLRLSVQSGYFDPHLNTLNHLYPPVPVPLIELKGPWLRDAGFGIGKEYLVSIGETSLSLIALPPGFDDRNFIAP